MNASTNTRCRKLGLTIALIAAASAAACSNDDGGSSWDRLALQGDCVVDPEDLLGIEILCEGDSASGTLNGLSNPFDVYGFEPPVDEIYEIVLRDFGDPDTFDLDLYIIDQNSDDLIAASESFDLARETVVVSLESGESIRIEVEIQGQVDSDRSYVLTIDAL
jgi:hypothetical protein